MNVDFAGVMRLDEVIHHNRITLPDECPRKPPKPTGKPYRATRCFKGRKVENKQK